MELPPLSKEQEHAIKAMPKIDLHYHLEGGVRPETLAEILGERDVEAIRRRLEVSGDCTSLPEFLEKFEYVTPLLKSPQTLKLAAEAAVREAAEQNLIYLEVRFAPGFLTTADMDESEVITHVLAGLEAGERRWGVPANAILILGLSSKPEENLALVNAALRLNSPRLVGVDVAGPEGAVPLSIHAEALQQARSGGLALTLHAGEAGPPANIETALALGARRIGHATSLYRDQALLRRVAAEGIGLELCPTSNLQTKAIRCWEDYHIRDYLTMGARCAICTDDPAVSGITLTGEYLLMARQFDIAAKDLLNIVRNAAEIAFCTEKDKDRLRRRIEEYAQR